MLVAIRWPLERRFGRRGEAADDVEDPRTLRERLEQDEDDHYEPDYAPARGRVRTEPRI